MNDGIAVAIRDIELAVGGGKRRSRVIERRLETGPVLRAGGAQWVGENDFD